MSQLTKYTKSQQEKLASYCRLGDADGLEGTTVGRIATYRRLVFNNVRDALERSYPLTKNALREKEWALLVNDFFEQHSCSHPQIWRMPEELIGHVVRHQPKLQSNYPLIIDLLHFEWKEIELHMMPNQHIEPGNCADPLGDAWHLNPEHELMQFSYPVHQKNARYISASDQGTYHCLGFRDPFEGKVHFINLTPLLAAILNKLARSSAPIQEVFNQVASEANIATPFTDVAPKLLDFYRSMHNKGLFIG
jgi:hypothetical protein